MTKHLPVMYKRCGLSKIYLTGYEEQYTGNKLLNIILHNIWCLSVPSNSTRAYFVKEKCLNLCSMFIHTEMLKFKQNYKTGYIGLFFKGV